MKNTFGEIVRVEKILGLSNGVQLYNPAEIEKVKKHNLKVLQFTDLHNI